MKSKNGKKSFCGNENRKIREKNTMQISRWKLTQRGIKEQRGGGDRERDGVVRESDR